MTHTLRHLSRISVSSLRATQASRTDLKHSPNVVLALANVLVKLCKLGSRRIQQLGGLLHSPQPSFSCEH